MSESKNAEITEMDRDAAKVFFRNIGSIDDCRVGKREIEDLAEHFANHRAAAVKERDGKWAIVERAATHDNWAEFVPPDVYMVLQRLKSKAVRGMMREACDHTAKIVRLEEEKESLAADLAAALKAKDASQEREKGLRAEVVALTKDLRIAEKKLSTSLANNLCPDHRDKQLGKPCLACMIERLERTQQPPASEVQS